MHGRIGIVALVVMALVVVAAAQAEAHWEIKNGKLVYTSLDCTNLLQGWDPLTEAAVGRCLTVGTIVEVVCAGPQGQIVKGTASHPVLFDPVEGPVATDKITKKGKSFSAAGHLTLEILSDEEVPTLGLGPEDGVCNNNWTVNRAILREADLTVQACPCQVTIGADGRATCALDSGGNPIVIGLESEQLFRCTLPAEFTFDNPPTDGVQYSCVKIGTAAHYNPPLAGACQ